VPLFLLFGIVTAGFCEDDTAMRVAATSQPIDIIGYYGNSGNVQSFIPRITDIPSEYNILIVTFADFPSIGSPIELQIIGPYVGNYAFPDTPSQLIEDMAIWKNRPDPYGRSRKVLISIGGQNGHFPSDGDPDIIKDKLVEFIDAYHFDGLDIDLEGGTIQSTGSLTDVITYLMNHEYVVTAAPEAAQSSLNAYQSIIPLLSWVHPQFYNNPPNAVIKPWIPEGCDFCSATDWQERQCEDIANWALVLQTMASYLGLTSDRLGMLMPTTPSAAGSYNDWDIQLLAQQVEENNIRHVGTWAIAYDHTIDYAFAKTIAGLMDKPGNLYVSSDGDCGDKQPCYGAIQNAINDAVTGSVLLVKQGTYPESISLGSQKSLVIKGGYDSTYSQQTADKTFIQGVGRTRIQAPSGSLTLQMLTIKP
ncbi:MAG: hypothetical protein JRJ85_23525, partial [Deltaproteobacteria bacterium]|nr:hypothetical protein [Deltaproteobacteria bacterium]